MRQLSAALRQGHVLIDAPPGYGKSTLLRTFALNTPQAHYLALAPGDADLSQLQARLQPWLRPGAIILLDDVHVLNDASETTLWLIDQLRASIGRFALSGRQLLSMIEPFVQARFTAADLAFTPNETAALLSDHDRSSDWHARTQGWPLALALIARGPIDPAAPPRPASLFEYLAETMLRGLPVDLLRYLQITSVPLRFSDELAAALSDETIDRAVERRAEVQRRNLFLETTDQPGWFKYHDLIRQFLATTRADSEPLFDRAVHWFESHGNREQAIEHALAGQRYDSAIRLLLDVPVSFVRGQGRFHTYRRWVLSLPDDLLDQHPALLVQLGYYLFDVPGWRDEAWTHVQRALAVAERNGDHIVDLQARTRLGLFQYRTGEYAAALNTLQAVLNDDRLPEADRRYALRLKCVVLGETNRFREARRAYLEAIALAQAAGDVEEELFNRQNLAITVLAPLGEFAEAAAHMQIALDHYVDLPGLRVRALHMLCDLHLYTGDWEALERAQDEIAALTQSVESIEAGDQVWPSFYCAVIATGRGDLNTARLLLDKFSQTARRTPVVEISAAWLDCWLLRRERRYAEMIDRAEAVLAGDHPVPFFRAQIALWRDVARWSLAAPHDPPLDLHPEVCGFLRWRARAELVFVRAWLALETRRRRDPRWRQHARAVLRALDRPGYARLLTQRDPDLGVQFWMVCLIEDVASEKAIAALREIGSIEKVAPLLAHADSAVRARAAHALAAIGREAALPFLTEALEHEQNALAAQKIEAAVLALEGSDPPILRVKLMGEFSLSRGDQTIGAGDWPRPAVRRLFQYFALHRGQRLSRDRILEDLWPEADPSSARVSFKQVFSWLRKVIEPYMRPRAASRYIDVDDDVYCFDPRRAVVAIDADEFEACVRPIMRAVDHYDLPPLPEALLIALEGWQPLLPDLLYEAWALEPREKLLGLYVEGCLYVAQALLGRDRAAEAIGWAQRAVERAPWLEEGYQVLMRAHARQGNRSLALKTYDEAVAALQREMNLAPSALTQWLAQRLRDGEEI